MPPYDCAALLQRCTLPEAHAGYTITALAPRARQADDGFRWTGKYLRNNVHLREVVTTLLELVHLPPHESLHGGRTHVTIGVECDHDKVACLLGSSSDHLRGKHQVGGG